MLAGIFSCEKRIDIAFDNGPELLVVEADLDNSSAQHMIYLHRNAAYMDTLPPAPITDAHIRVLTEAGESFEFNYNEQQQAYINDQMPIVEAKKYTLKIKWHETTYEASDVVQTMVLINDVTMTKESILGAQFNTITMHVEDPEDQANYYKYSILIGDQPPRFVGIFNDQHNNGNTLSHHIRYESIAALADTEIKIKLQLVSFDNYKYWDQIKNNTPFSIVPLQPASNISHGALGYFSVSQSDIYMIK